MGFCYSSPSLALQWAGFNELRHDATLAFLGAYRDSFNGHINRDGHLAFEGSRLLEALPSWVSERT